MRRLFIILIFLVLFSCDLADRSLSYSEYDPSSKEATPANLAYVFDITAVPLITVTISTNEWNTLLTNYDHLNENEEMVHADFSFEKNGEAVHLPNIGFRIRGNTSRQRPEISLDYTNGYIPGGLHGQSNTYYLSTHFRIGFDHFVKGQRLYGLKNLNLKWFKDDPLYAREIFGYDLFRRVGVWCTPEATYSRLIIKFKETGEAVYFGPYNMIEAVDRVFIEAHFPQSSGGFLWKCLYKGYGATLNYPVSSDAFGIEEATPDYVWTPTYDLKTRKEDFASAQAQFENWIRELNTLTPGSPALMTWLNNNLAVDLFLRVLAVGTQIGHWDSYWNLGQNYYLYFDEGGKAYFIPYDHDNILGTAAGGWGNPATYDVVAITNEDRALVRKVLSIPAFRDTYYQYLKILIHHNEDYFFYTAVTNRIIQWQNTISLHMTNIGVVPALNNGYNTISDETGYWSSFPYFRIFSGDESGDGTNAPPCNYVKSRIQFTAQQIDLPPRIWDTVYQHKYTQMYFTGSYPGLDWTNSLPMTLVADYTWQIMMTNVLITNYFKFKTHRTNWSDPEWGDPNHDGVADLHQYYSMYTANTGEVIFTFHEQTLQYTPYE